MHELSIAMELQRRCGALHAPGAPLRLRSARVAVGELSSVDPRLLELAWEGLVAGGPDQGARLEVEWRPARQTCATCGEVAERQPGTWLRLCPTCRAPLRVEGGGELDLLQASFAEPDPAEASPC